jgi:segregation and condensation protein A
MAQHGTMSMSVREFETKPGYRVRLPLFEGPLDLLLFLIQKNEIDIYDIPIAQVTQEFLEYLKFMRLIQLDVAADFLVMATILMSIKSQLLLPQPSHPEEFFQEDPRQELMNRLLEYRLYKAAAQTLEDKEEKTTLLYARSPEQSWEEKEQEGDLIEVNLYDLLAAFKEVVERESKPSAHEIVLEEVTVKERFDYIREALLHRKRIPFVELIRSDPRKMVMVVTFLAILELIRSQMVAVKQQRPFGEIWVYRKIATGGEHHPFCEVR